MKKQKIFVLFAVVLGMTADFSGPIFISEAHALSDKIYRELSTFTRIIEIVDQQYVEPVDEEKLIEGAIRGMLASLDPYTVYLPPEMYRDFKSDTTGKFGGIGIEVTIKEGVLTVVAPIEDSPAHRGGIQSGDKILKIDGRSTKDMTLVDAVHAMRGSKGKKVVLTVWREGFSGGRDYTIVRDIIQVLPVKSEFLEGGYAYLRITSFQEKTADFLKKILKEMIDTHQSPLKGVLLDLRDDPGGLLSEAVRVSDLFMDKGVVVSTKGRGNKPEVKEARPNSPYEKVPLVVLVNHGSASASEIVAGALQDTHRAKILGTPTFGKGSVQTVLDMGEKAALKMTVAKYYTPKGRSIEGEGIIPDMIVDAEDLKKEYARVAEKERPPLDKYQKEKAIEYLKRL